VVEQLEDLQLHLDKWSLIVQKDVLAPFNDIKARLNLPSTAAARGSARQVGCTVILYTVRSYCVRVGWLLPTVGTWCFRAMCGSKYSQNTSSKFVVKPIHALRTRADYQGRVAASGQSCSRCKAVADELCDAPLVILGFQISGRGTVWSLWRYTPPFGRLCEAS
jgi:hypothetical protein